MTNTRATTKTRSRNRRGKNFAARANSTAVRGRRASESALRPCRRRRLLRREQPLHVLAQDARARRRQLACQPGVARGTSSGALLRGARLDKHKNGVEVGGIPLLLRQLAVGGDAAGRVPYPAAAGARGSEYGDLWDLSTSKMRIKTLSPAAHPPMLRSTQYWRHRSLRGFSALRLSRTNLEKFFQTFTCGRRAGSAGCGRGCGQRPAAHSTGSPSACLEANLPGQLLQGGELDQILRAVFNRVLQSEAAH